MTEPKTPRKRTTPRAQPAAPAVLPQAKKGEKPARVTRDPNAPKNPAAIVQRHGDWYLVTYASFQTSIAPDGRIMLPRDLHVDDVDDFKMCADVAKEVALKVIAANESKGAKQLTETVAAVAALSTRHAVITQGPPPQGTRRMQAVSAQQRAASIGRSKRRSSKAPAIETARPSARQAPR